MRLALLLFWIVFTFGQSTSSPPDLKAQPPADSSSQKQDYGLATGAKGTQIGSFEILSDPKGVDFKPYLQQILPVVRQNWYLLIPESATPKRGKLAIEFAITKDGRVADMRLVASSGDVALDRPAWGSITNSNPFQPLPSEFTGTYIALRFRFYYNPDGSEFKDNGLTRESHTKSKSGIVVSISTPGSLDVQAGGSQVVTATVTGTEEKVVEWAITGSSCSGSGCGKMVGDLYLAPSAIPSVPDVTLTAIAKADPTAKASVTVHIVQPPSHKAKNPL
jgi:TonB family protein